MTNNKIKKIADRLIPEDLRSILLSLDSHLKWAILSDLSGGEKSFTQLRKDLGTDNKLLAYNLNKLLENGIIRHYYKHEFFKPNYSFYELTNIGKNIIKSIDYIFYFPKIETHSELPASTDVNSAPVESEEGEIGEISLGHYILATSSIRFAKRRSIRELIPAEDSRRLLNTLTTALATRATPVTSVSNPPTQYGMFLSRAPHHEPSRVHYK